MPDVTITDQDLCREDIPSTGKSLGSGFKARLAHGKAITDGQGFIIGHQHFMLITYSQADLDVPIAQLWGEHLVVLGNDLSWRRQVTLLNKLKVKRRGDLVHFSSKVTTYPGLRELFYRWHEEDVRVGMYSPAISY